MIDIDRIQRPLIFLACPYAHADPAVREFRFKAVSMLAGRLCAEGNLVYSAITHSHPMDAYAKLGTNHYTDWVYLNDFYLSKSDIMIVLTLPGWESSEGVAHEINMMNELGKPIIYLPVECD